MTEESWFSPGCVQEYRKDSDKHLCTLLGNEYLTCLFQSIPKDGKKSRQRDENQSTDEEDYSENEKDNDSESEGQENIEEQNEESGDLDDEEDWLKFQEEAKKDNSLETKSKETFPVHCPYYPGVSYLSAKDKQGSTVHCLLPRR